MRTIWKYEIPIVDEFQLRLPAGSRALTVQLQGDEPQLWVEVSTDPECLEEKTRHQFYVVGTGNPVPEKATIYLGTWQQDRFVWHLYTETLLPR